MGIFQVGLEDTEEAKKWIKHQGSGSIGRTIRVERLERCLILNTKQKLIKIVEIKENGQPGRELSIKADGGDIIDHQACGLESNRFAVLHEDGFLRLFEYDLEEMTYRTIDELKIPLMAQRREECLTLAICQDSEFFAIQTRSLGFPCKASRVLMYCLENECFELKAELDVFGESLAEMQSMIFYGYSADDHLVLTALTDESPSLVMTLAYNITQAKFVEMPLRKYADVKWPRKLSKVDQVLISSDQDSKKIRIIYIV